MAETGSTDGGDDDDDDDAGCGDGKRKVGCEGEADDDSDDNDNIGVNDDGGIDINDGYYANGGDSMSKADCDDDPDGGGGNSNDDGSVDGDVTFGNWCADGEGGDKAGDGDEQCCRWPCWM